MESAPSKPTIQRRLLCFLWQCLITYVPIFVKSGRSAVPAGCIFFGIPRAHQLLDVVSIGAFATNVLIVVQAGRFFFDILRAHQLLDVVSIGAFATMPPHLSCNHHQQCWAAQAVLPLSPISARHWSLATMKRVNTQTHRYTHRYTHTHHTDTQIHRYTHIHIHIRTDTQIHTHSYITHTHTTPRTPHHTSVVSASYHYC